MVANRKVTGTASSMPAGLAVGGMISLVITLAGAILTGYLISKETIAESSIGYCAIVILLTASVLGALTAVRKIKRRRVYVCGLSGVIYYGMLLAMTALFFGGIYQGMGVTGLVILTGCAIALLFSAKGEKSPGYRKHKNRNR